MSSLIAKLWTKLCPKRAPLSIMIVGLDNSGKTSILNTLESLNHSGSGGIGNSTLSYQSQTAPTPGLGATETPTLSSTSMATTVTTATPGTAEATTTPPTTNTLLSSDDSKGDNALSGNWTNSSSGNSSSDIMPTVGYNYERVQYRSLTITVLDFSGQNRYRNLWQEFYNGVDGIVFVIDSSDLISTLSAALDGCLTTSTTTGSALTTSPSLVLAPNNSAIAVQKQLTIIQGKLIQTTLDLGAPLPSAIANKLSGSAALVSGHQLQQQSVNGRKQHANSGTVSNSHSRRRTKVPILFLANKTDLPNSVDTEFISKALNLNQLPSDRHPWFIQATSINLNQGIVEGFDWLVTQLTAN